MYQTQRTRMTKKAVLQAIQRQVLTLATEIKERLWTLATVIYKKKLSNWTLLIVTTTMDPRVDDRIATCGGTPNTLAIPTTKEVILVAE